MLEAKIAKVKKIIDFLINVEMFWKKILSDEQIIYFKRYKLTVDNIVDEENLDTVTYNLLITMNKLSKQIAVYARNISMEQRKFLEWVDKFEDNQHLEWFINLI